MRRVIFLIVYVSCFTPPLQAQSDFYKGKQMKIVVGASTGAASDLYARVVAHHLPKQIPGKPDIIVQNMPGGGSITAANYVYSVAKPDGLTLGAVTAPIYFAQLLGRKEVQFDWGKFTWIGTPEENDELFFIRSDQPYKTLLDLRKASEPPRCGASGVGSTGFYIPKLLEEIFGLKINMVTGYPGAADVDVAVEKNEVHCRGTTISAFFGREPGRDLGQEWLCEVPCTDGGQEKSSTAGHADNLGIDGPRKGNGGKTTFSTSRARPGGFWSADIGDSGDSCRPSEDSARRLYADA